MSNLIIYQYIADFDNSELPDDERIEQLEDAARTYNEENGTVYDVRKVVDKYLCMKRGFNIFQDGEQDIDEYADSMGL